MYKDSYNQRLKQIRQKYGASIKDTTSCLKSNDRTSLKLDSRNYDVNDKYSMQRKFNQTYSDKKASQNIEPLSTTFSSKYSTSLLKENEPAKNYDSFLNTQTKDQRLRQIEKIRKNFAQSRNKAVEDFNRNLQRSKSKYLETQKFGGLKQRVNTNYNYNPQDLKTSLKQVSNKQSYRNRAQSSYTSNRIEPDLQLNRELKRNYDYNYDYETVEKGSKVYDRIEVDRKGLSSYRNNSITKFQSDNYKLSTYGAGKIGQSNDSYKNITKIDSQTTSPIRGLMKFDSLQKPRKTQLSQPPLNIPKLSANTYDLTNIDRIQQRIQKILSKK